MTNTTIQLDQDTTVTMKAARFWTLLMAVRDWWRTRGKACNVVADPDWLRHVKIEVVPDPGPQIQDKATAFHAGPVTLILDEDGQPVWELLDEIECPDLAENWKTYPEWLPTMTYLN
jgi:hypothetical protein